MAKGFLGRFFLSLKICIDSWFVASQISAYPPIPFNAKIFPFFRAAMAFLIGFGVVFKKGIIWESKRGLSL